MKIAYVMNSFDFSDVSKAHGVGYYIVKNLEAAGNQVEIVGGEDLFYENFLKAKQLLYKVNKKVYLRHRDIELLSKQSKQIDKQISEINPDIIFSFGSLPIAMLESNKPKFFWTDATFEGIKDYNEFYKNLCVRSILDGNFLEQKALNESKLCFFASDWAKQTAIDNYDVAPNKLKVCPLGANIDTARNLDEITSSIDKRINSKLKLLFMGKNWKWKGGDILLEIFNYLEQNSIDVQLDIVGCTPSIPSNPDIKIHGLIDNRTQQGKKQIDELYSEASFFVLPTRFESYGHVFCEANSFGIPNLAPDTGGISTIIKNDINGFLFDYDAEPKEYAEKIIEIWNDKDRYKELCVSSFNEYQTRLNWESSTKKVLEEIDKVL
jgi:glycosyltransferase involved in cell wall biosynthesis